MLDRGACCLLTWLTRAGGTAAGLIWTPHRATLPRGRIEGVTVVLGNVANAVEVDVARCAEAAQTDVVAHAAAFTGSK
jgi:hypothetical protein